MANQGDTLQLSPNERLTIQTTTEASGGELLAMEATYEPSGDRPPEHFHPAQEERFTGISGTVTARVDGVERQLGPGDELTIEPGVKHAFWNAGSEPATIRWEVRPALRTEQMFEDLAHAGSTAKKALVLPRYKEEFRLSDAQQRFALDLVARLAKLIGLGR